MSKMDNLRAMREARYEAAQARAKAAGGTTKATRASVAPDATPAEPVKKAKPAAKKAASPATAGADEALCGHRNMSGRTCTRVQGHSEKSHRYS